MPLVTWRCPFRLDKIDPSPSVLCDTHNAWFGRKWVGICWVWVGICWVWILFNRVKWGGGALIICYNKPVWLCHLWPDGARSGSIQSIQACWATPTVLPVAHLTNITINKYMCWRGENRQRWGAVQQGVTRRKAARQQVILLLFKLFSLV
jgi:hypothetical protein